MSTSPLKNAESTVTQVHKPLGATPIPIGVFWDIENCSVPRGKSALAVVQRIRNKFFADHTEVEFMCVCDISKENKDVIEELNYAQVTVVHINATSKNAADDKLRQSLRRFASSHQAPASVILVSGDINFASELSDLRYRHKFHVILIHRQHVQEALLACANESYEFDELVSDIAIRALPKLGDAPCELLVKDLPLSEGNVGAIKSRLKQLSDNCGGKVRNIHRTTALVRFPTADAASRARKRMDGEDVFGNKISVELASGERPNAACAPQTKTRTNMRKRQVSPDKVSKSRQQRHKGSGGSQPQRYRRHSGGSPSHYSDDGSDRNGLTSPGYRRQHRYGGSRSDSLLGQRPQVKRECSSSSPSEVHDSFPDFQPGLLRAPDSYGGGEAEPQCEADQNNNCTEEEPGQLGRGLQEVVAKFAKDQKSSREVLLLQQQLYQEGQLEGTTSYDAYGQAEENGSLSGGSQTQTTPLPSRQHTPHVGNEESQRRSSLQFRRTPGASRPNSRPGSRASSRNSFCANSPLFSDQNSSSLFQPIKGDSPSGLLSASDLSSHPTDSQKSPSTSDPNQVELKVSNLDYNISAREWRKILFAEFDQYVTVLGVHTQTQPDNSTVGIVKVASVDEARFAIAQFHRKKIGYKRIHVVRVNNEAGSTATNVKCEVITLLREVVGNTLPLFKFIELFEKRYHRTISVSELYRMKDIVEITDHSGTGRMVGLTNTIRNSPVTLDPADQEVQEIIESPVCKIHAAENIKDVESVDFTLPNVNLALRHFAPQIHTLLQTHDGNMPLMSLTTCHAVEFSPLTPVEGGVSLEHLISCVPGVKIATLPCGIKKVQWAENRPPSASEPARHCTSPLMNQQLSQFARETVELLKQLPHCRVQFSKFIPAYHHHFGRQCRVADYGYSKLMEVLEAIPHVVQVLGGSSRRMITLSHRAQVKRFTSDMLRVLKSQASKQINVMDIPIVHNKVIGKPFDVTDYGVCYVEDMLSEVPETTIQVTGIGEEMVLAIPRRDQTPEEMERTRQFAVEVVDLLKHSPQCRMPFSRFIPSYHHHFGKQCRVADYGFTKLMELFEAIPHVLKVLEDREEKDLCLTEKELVKVLSEQVTSLLKSCPKQELPLAEFMPGYQRFFGHCIHLADYDVESIEELVEKISHVAKVEDRDGEAVVALVDYSHLQQLAHRILLLLMDQSDGKMTIKQLTSRYQQLFGYGLDLAEICRDLQDVVEVTDQEPSGIIKLTSVQMFARDVRTLLRNHQSRLFLQDFEAAYAQMYGVSLVPASYGYPSLVSLLQAIPHVALIRGRGFRRSVLLCQDFQGKLSQVISPRKPTVAPSAETSPDVPEAKPNTPSNDSGITELQDEEERDASLLQSSSKKDQQGTVRAKSPLDLLSSPIPSALPSPDITPSTWAKVPPELMRFDPSPPPVSDELFSGLTDDEKRGQKTPLCKTPVSDMLQFAAQLLTPDLAPNYTQEQSHLQVSSGTFTYAAAAMSQLPFQGQSSPMEAVTGVLEQASVPKVDAAKPEDEPIAPVAGNQSPVKSDTTETGSQGEPQVPASPCSSCDTPRSTPKKCRIAARFSLPLSPDPCNSGN